MQIALTLLAAIIFTTVSTSVFAQVSDPHPLLMDPRVIVISENTAFDDPALIKIIAGRPTEEEIVRFVSAEFAKQGINILVTDRWHYDGPPGGLLQDAILFAHLRIDLSSMNVGTGELIVVGSVSTTFHRADFTLPSPMTNSFFGGRAEDPQLDERANEAIFRQVSRSLIELLIPIVKH
jgi:hypothetical protein